MADSQLDAGFPLLCSPASPEAPCADAQFSVVVYTAGHMGSAAHMAVLANGLVVYASLDGVAGLHVAAGARSMAGAE